MNDRNKFIDRELSTLEFNGRVLAEAMNPASPLLERLKFVATMSANLDEFYMVRMASLKNAQLPINDIRDKAAALIETRDRYFLDTLLPELEAAGLKRTKISACAPDQLKFLADYFHDHLFPLLTPVMLCEGKPLPALWNLQLHVMVGLAPHSKPDQKKYAVIEVPHKALPHVLFLPAATGHQFVLLEDVIAHFACDIFRGYDVLETGLMRLTRGMELSWEESNDEDFLQTLSQSLHERQASDVVRLEVSYDNGWSHFLRAKLGLSDAEVYYNRCWIDRKTVSELMQRPGLELHKRTPWQARAVPELALQDDPWTLLKERDVLLFHPYQSFHVVSDFLERAAEDPDVLAIKQTIYRTDRDSPVLSALEKAARRGKRVTVSLELKARFDEENNMAWAKRLAKAGASVFYGVAGLKTHAKVCLIVRKEKNEVRRYAHISTGNYSAENSRSYSDIGLLTGHPDITHDIGGFFNMITGGSEPREWKKIKTAPHSLRRHFLELIEREIRLSTPERPGLIRAKMNSLADAEMIEALYRASDAGVKVELNVRGLCCLKPGVRGLSDNIRVVSIVDQFLEHSRLYYFGNGGREEIYLASADWMTRNLDRRLELLVPIEDPASRRKLIETLEMYFQDNVNAWALEADGFYRRLAPAQDHRPFRAQEALCRRAIDDEQTLRTIFPMERQLRLVM